MGPGQSPNPQGRIARRRVPLMGLAMLSMACGVWLGLVRLGWNLPLLSQDQLIAHGPLMVCGFLGTLISVERAVALGSRWGYAAPLLVVAGVIALDLPSYVVGPLLVTAGSVVLVAVFVALCRRQLTLFMITMAVGAVAWVVGNSLWLAGWAIARVVWWWVAFLVLTIAGERLELNRVLRPTRAITAAFASAAALLVIGVAVSATWPESGVRIAGVALLALAIWLARYDVARRTVRQQGLTRYMAVGLLTGYAWLAAGGVIAAITGVAETGLVYDATLHAVFLGFVMSMVFAHAPVIFPAVIGRPLPYAPRFYAHVIALHLSLIVRVVGDLNEDLGRWRAWGGVLNAVALGFFVLNVGRSIVLGSRTATDASMQQVNRPLTATD